MSSVILRTQFNGVIYARPERSQTLVRALAEDCGDGFCLATVIEAAGGGVSGDLKMVI